MTPSPDMAEHWMKRHDEAVEELWATRAERDRLRAALEDHLSGRIGHVRLREALDPTEAPTRYLVRDPARPDLDVPIPRGATP